MSDAVLYGYFRSTAAYRVRIALNLKGLSADHRFVHLRKGEQTQESYRKINPAGLVPYWIDGDLQLAQSLAIIEYLDETHPQPPLLPPDAKGRAVAREIALVAVSDIHPIGNLRVLNRLIEMGVDEATRLRCHRGKAFAASGAVLPWRNSDTGGHLPRTAGVQCAPLRRGPCALQAYLGRRCGRRET